MLQKWKLIVNNWINCYFDENNQERILKVECLLNIISHLRENLNLDESKSSILEAHTVEQFILEKYPYFKFENRLELASNEEEIYLAASLLLFFVCVNSKDVNMKSAMCNKLSRGDQEIILKFSKNLMECNHITCKDVQTAIADACGVDIATIDTGHVTVAETPPVLRSLHSEVRRLQAALDAERFDRNYLQDELSRTNLKLEKLVKDKEQYKVEIINLKTKLSLCSSGDHIARSVDSESEHSAKLARQLEDMEEQLVRTQEMLDDAVYERDSYKTKIHVLKQDRDKWLSQSQQESARSVQLAEDLEMERRHIQSLKELVTDLRQHNRLNGLDGSQLECDDPDASVQSLAHSLSVCSEVCANVVEVQLSEERAKVDALKQQIEVLLDYQSKAEKELEERRNECICLEKEIQVIRSKVESCEKDSAAKDEFIFKINTEKDSVINNVNKKLTAEKNLRERCQKEIEEKNTAINQLKHDLNQLNKERETLNILLKENEELIKSLEQREPPECDGSCAKVTEVQVQLSEERDKADALKQKIKSLQDEMVNYKVMLAKKCDLLQDYQLKTEKELEERQQDILYLQKGIQALQCKVESCEKDLALKNEFITKMNTVINNVNKELTAEKNLKERCQNDIEEKNTAINQLKHELNQLKDEKEALNILLKENEELMKALAQREPPACDGSCAKVTEVQVQLSEERDKGDALKQQIISLQDEIVNDKVTLAKKCDIFHNYQLKTVKELEEREKQVIYLQKEIHVLQSKVESCEKDLTVKDEFITKMNSEKDGIINNVKKELRAEKDLRERCQKDMEENNIAINQLKHELNQLKREREAFNVLLKENEELIKALEQREPPVCDGSCAKVTEVQVQLSEERAKADALKQQIESLQDEIVNDKVTLANKCDILQDYQLKTEKGLEERQKEISNLQKAIQGLQRKVEFYEKDSASKDQYIINMENEKVAIMNNMNKELTTEKDLREKCARDLEEKNITINQLKLDLNQLSSEREALNIVKKENEKLIKALEQKETAMCDGSCAKVSELQVKLDEERANADVLKQQIESLQLLQVEMVNDKVTLANKCEFLQGYMLNAEKELEAKQNEVLLLQKEIQVLQSKVESCEKDLAVKEELITEMHNEKDALINNVNKELKEEKDLRERCLKDIDEKNTVINQLKFDLNQMSSEREALNVLKGENEKLIKVLEQRAICSETLVNNLKEELSEGKARINALQQQIESSKDYQLKVENELEEKHTEILYLQIEIQTLQSKIQSCEKECAAKEEYCCEIIKDKDAVIDGVHKELIAEKNLRERYQKDIEEKNTAINQLKLELTQLSKEREALSILKKENQELIKAIELKDASMCSEAHVNDLEVRLREERAEVEEFKQQIVFLKDCQSKAEKESDERQKEIEHLQTEIQALQTKVQSSEKESAAKDVLLSESTKVKDAVIGNVNKELAAEKDLRERYQKDIELKNTAIDQLKHDLNELINEREALNILKKENEELIKAVEQRELSVYSEAFAKAIEVQLTEEKAKVDALNHHIKSLEDEMAKDKVTLTNQCDILQDYQLKAEKELEERRKESVSLQKEIQFLQTKVESYEKDSAAKDDFISKIIKGKDDIINNVNKELAMQKNLRESYQKDIEEKNAAINQLKLDLNQLNNEREALNILKKENEELIKVIGQRETFGVRSQGNASSQKNSGQLSEKELRELHHQVDNSSDNTYSSIESLKTISDLEKIIHDKNRTITVLQTDITYLKNLMAESETKLLDVTKELEMSKENCHQLSSQLKKIVYQKNIEIGDLKKQVNKMSANETRATQIIKVSAKYQAIILKRIAEIKCNTVLKELTNYGNTNTSEDELRRSLNAGSITMEDLENFLETTERHIKKCSEKQSILQKERDRLAEVNRINESETINLKKFLTELSVSFQTFASVKDLYAQKLSRVISVQRTVRREILSLDGHITDACMLKLERGYAAVMQDLSECVMNLERWVERCIGRTISSEKIKQAFMNDNERVSLAPPSVKNTGLEVQLDELENSFQKLLEEVSRAQKGEGAKEAQAVTVMEVRAEYEDKLNRMKAKMKQLYAEQIAVFKDKQKEEIAVLERELVRAREKLAQSSQQYEEHIRGLTVELWRVGEKFLRQKDEAEWLRRQQRSGSLMSLQHVRSAGLGPMEEEPGRPSDTHSLRSLPVNNNRASNKRESRGLHMSDEEEELFDNRLLKELAETPRRESVSSAPGQRLSVLQWRNSLCPPHLKSSYPAETQFVPALDEDEIKAMGTSAVRTQRKEVGITAYKKPGPPTPSKQAGRLSATDSELRESLRVDAGPQPSRKASTPSRIRSLFRTSKNNTAELNETPRTRRLSSIFRKKN